MGVIDGKIYDPDAMISDFNGVDVKGLQRPTSVRAATARSAHLPLIQEGPFGGIENVRVRLDQLFKGPGSSLICTSAVELSGNSMEMRTSFAETAVDKLPIETNVKKMSRFNILQPQQPDELRLGNGCESMPF